MPGVADPQRSGRRDLGPEAGGAFAVPGAENARKAARLAPGDRVETSSGDGRWTRFRVTSVHQYRTPQFRARKVYEPAEDTQLRLIICTGPPDDDGRCTWNLVISAVRERPGGG
ncbi:class F sortase [Streptomyces luteolus]|uniref:Class F sortase n=1 Tax=Streptomyces luteolus TaxID=3043615 RepID=A0ABT6TAB6_9ACTN|nr:class F sortase [Streptomyces sp. B-S-A12]MDI3423969.1 class F sortase [Streptomyces sp. B-S-A12]